MRLNGAGRQNAPKPFPGASDRVAQRGAPKSGRQSQAAGRADGPALAHAHMQAILSQAPDLTPDATHRNQADVVNQIKTGLLGLKDLVESDGPGAEEALEFLMNFAFHHNNKMAMMANQVLTHLYGNGFRKEQIIENAAHFVGNYNKDGGPLYNTHDIGNLVHYHKNRNQDGASEPVTQRLLHVGQDNLYAQQLRESLEAPQDRPELNGDSAESPPVMRVDDGGVYYHSPVDEAGSVGTFTDWSVWDEDASDEIDYGPADLSSLGPYWNASDEIVAAVPVEDLQKKLNSLETEIEELSRDVDSAFEALKDPETGVISSKKEPSSTCLKNTIPDLTLHYEKRQKLKSTRDTIWEAIRSQRQGSKFIAFFERNKADRENEQNSADLMGGMRAGQSPQPRANGGADTNVGENRDRPEAGDSSNTRAASSPSGQETTVPATDATAQSGL